MSTEETNEGVKAPEKKTTAKKSTRKPAVKAAVPARAAKQDVAQAVAAPAAQGRPDRSISPHKKRVPLGSRNRLSFNNLDPNYYYRVINDTDDRIDRAVEAGYEFVVSNKRLGDIQAGDDSPVGSQVKKAVGGGTVGYLMRQPMEFHNEDQQIKMDRIDELEESTKPKAELGQYGTGIVKTQK